MSKKKLRLAKRVWQPYDPRVNGVSYTMLSTFLTCRQKCRLKIDGWRSKAVGLALIMGDLCHKTAAAYRKDIQSGVLTEVPDYEDMQKYVEQAGKEWHEQNSRATPRTLENFELAFGYCEALMPMWAIHYGEEAFKRTWINVEDRFSHIIDVPVGDRIVKIPIMGLQDAVFRNPKRIKLNEIKTKSVFRPEVHSDTIHFRLQNLIYLIALWEQHEEVPAGIEYEVIRRPALRRKVAETFEQFIQRCADDVQTRPKWYFWKFNCMITKSELEDAKAELVGLLREFYLWWKGDLAHYKNTEQCEQMWGPCEYLGLCSSDDDTYLYKLGGKK